MKRTVTKVGLALALVTLVAAGGYASGPPQLDPGLMTYKVGVRGERQHLQCGLRHPE